MLIIKGGEKIPNPNIIPTPSFGLNYSLGGGLWTGRYHIIWGNSQAGKTTFALHTMGDAQKNGYVPVIIDAEGSITDEWLEKCGIDTNNRILMRSTRLEDILAAVMPMLRDKSANYIFLLDSINSVVMESFYNKDDGTGAIGIYARSQGAMFQQLSDAIIESTNHMFIFIAQKTIGKKGQHFVDQGKFGNAAEHWATNIIRLTASDSATDTERSKDEKIISRTVKWKLQKSKQAPVQGMIGYYSFSPQDATINRAAEAIDIAVKAKIIDKRGGWYYWGDNKYHGIKPLLESLSDDDLAQIMRELEGAEIDFDIEEDGD